MRRNVRRCARRSMRSQRRSGHGRSPPSTLSLALRVAEVRTHAGGQHIEKEDAVPLQPIFGPPHYEQPLCGLRFRVSPAAFFQVNVAAAEQLISLLRSQCGLSERTVLLDVCCGTGTIGLSMATAVRRVIGIELSDAAVADARANAALNEIGNATFLASKAEAAIKRVLTGLTAEDRQHLVAIVDPPRAGLHNDVVKALRACEPLARLLYVSCHAGLRRQRRPALPATSKAYAGTPFEPKHAWPSASSPTPSTPSSSCSSRAAAARLRGRAARRARPRCRGGRAAAAGPRTRRRPRKFSIQTTHALGLSGFGK